MIRSRLAVAALLFMALASGPAAPQQQPPFIEIRPPIPTGATGKVEVIEFFWYACGACYAFEPHLERWLQKLPKDVEFKRVPAMFNERVAIAARVYYTLEAIGEVHRVHRPLFDAIHTQSLRITDERQLNQWLQRQNVDLAKFAAAYKSFGVESRLRRAAELQDASKIDGVPALVVHGRYAVTYSEKTLAVTDALIEQLRKQLAAGAPKK